MKNILLYILVISLTCISFNLGLWSIEPVHSGTPQNLPARTVAPPLNDMVAIVRPPQRIPIISMPESDDGEYSDYDHMKCLEQAQLEPRGKKRNDARRNCNQSLQ